MKKIIVILKSDDKLQRQVIREHLTSFLASETECVTALQSDYIDKITVLDVDPNIYKNELEVVNAISKNRIYANGKDPIEKGQIVIGENGAFVFDKYDNYSMVDVKGHKHYQFKSFGTELDLQVKESIAKGSLDYKKESWYDKITSWLLSIFITALLLNWLDLISIHKVLVLFLILGSLIIIMPEINKFFRRK